MNTFIATPSQPAASVLVENTNPFFPALDLAQFRREMRVDNDVSDERASEQITTAMLFLNAEIADAFFQPQYYPDDAVLPPNSDSAHWYKIALYHRAKAYILEQYRDTDSTKSGHRRADEMESRIDVYLQRSREALCRLLRRPMVDIALV